jgi:hypothetical protein
VNTRRYVFETDYYFSCTNVIGGCVFAKRGRSKKGDSHEKIQRLP